MKHTLTKRLGAILTGAMVFTSFALAAPMKEAHQIDILAQTANDENGWFVMPEQAGDWDKWCYAVTDLDRDGNWEIFKAKRGDWDSAPELRCEELIEGKWERHWGLFLVGGTDIPDILSGKEVSAPRTLHDRENNHYYYIFTETIHHGEYETIVKQYAISLGGDLTVEELACEREELSGYDGAITRTFYLPGWLQIEAESG